MNPKDYMAYCNRGGAHVAKGECGLAVADCTEAIRLNPRDNAAYKNRGLAHIENGDPDLAIADFTEAIRLDPKCDEAYADRGRVYLERDDISKGLADYNALLRLASPLAEQVKPKLVNAYLRSRNQFIEKGDWDSAINACNKAVAIDPEDFETYDIRGDVYLKEGRHRSRHRRLCRSNSAPSQRHLRGSSWSRFGVFGASRV